MVSKDKLNSMLAGEKVQTPPIRRGRGVQLSTEPSPDMGIAEDDAKSHHRIIAPEHRPEIKRVNRGYKLREDYIKACKRLALDTDRPLYEVMEEALREHLERHGVEVAH